MKCFLTTAAAAMVTLATSVSVQANEYEAALRDLATSQLQAWANASEVTTAIVAQNTEHAGLSQADIDSLDQAWRAEVGTANSPLIDDLLSRPASELLKSLQEQTEGLVTEVFIMDNRGLNVAQSAVTSDFWQGDEAKWQDTFLNGAGAMHFGEVELDESTQTYQTQLSMSITDPATNEVIGAVTFGIDVGFLE